MYRDPSTPVVKQLFSEKGDIPDLQDIDCELLHYFHRPYRARFCETLILASLGTFSVQENLSEDSVTFLGAPSEKDSLECLLLIREFAS